MKMWFFCQRILHYMMLNLTCFSPERSSPPLGLGTLQWEIRDQALPDGKKTDIRHAWNVLYQRPHVLSTKAI